jgi:hypothetical protein
LTRVHPIGVNVSIGLVILRIVTILAFKILWIIGTIPQWVLTEEVDVGQLRKRNGKEGMGKREKGS